MANVHKEAGATYKRIVSLNLLGITHVIFFRREMVLSENGEIFLKIVMMSNDYKIMMNIIY